MANASYAVEKISFEFNAGFTEVEVWCGPTSDGTLGVQGLHKKAFPADRSALDILSNEIARGEYLLW